jgi:kynureninase
LIANIGEFVSLKSSILFFGMEFRNSFDFARNADYDDPLRGFRDKFWFPKIDGKRVVYLCGNSLGLQPKNVKDAILGELCDWRDFAVEGHFKAKYPWFSYHEQFAEPVSKIVGALPQEVVVMNQLTVNLHLLMVSFYRPDKKRCKIICEAKAFPSDQYALETQVRYHGFDPEEAIIEIQAREGENIIRDSDIIEAIEKAGDTLALVMIGGVNYYTGQVFDMQAIAKAAHEVGAYAGFDLAHAAGNIKMHLHDWNVDFGCWCSYKYLNSGPGGVSGVFIHEKHATNPEIPRFGGWWGYDKAKRFKMEKNFDPIKTAEGWQLSNAPILMMAAHKASLEIFEQAGMDALTEKSAKLTDYLEFIIEDINILIKDEDRKLEVITPKERDRRGCQLSVLAHGRGKDLFYSLLEEGVIADWREPNVIRLAPAPLYNSFEDCWAFGRTLEKLIL